MKLKHKKLASLLILFSFLSYMPLSTTAALATGIDPSASAIQAGSSSMPSINNTINGSVNVNGNQMDVVVNGGAGAVGQFDWNSFNVGTGNTVNFGFSNNHQTSLNRVLAGGGLSQIYGKLMNSCAGAGDCSSYAGTGKVILINPAGIMFGAGSQVDLNSFTATSFDLKGAKNIKDMSEAELNAYKAQLNIKGKDANGNVILSDMVSGAQFIRDGVLTTQDGATVTLEGSKFNIDKSLGIAADNVKIYKDSLIKTNTGTFNYGGGLKPENHNQSFSNVRIVTADGVNFNYQINGNINKSQAVNKNKNIVHKLDITDSEIQSGMIRLENAGTKTGSDINIKNSIVRGVKLVNGEYGDIFIQGANDINIDGSHLATNNKTNYANGASSANQAGGRIMVNAGKNATVTNTKIETASSTNNQYDTNTTTGKKVIGSGAGDATILANNGNATVTNTNIMSKGNIMIAATGKTNIKDSALQAKNLGNRDLLKTVEITGGQGITLDNTYSESTDRTTLNTISGKAPDFKGSTINVKNGSTIFAGKALNMYGTDTTIADSTLVFNGLNFINPNSTSILNNVTISGTTALNDQSSLDGLKVTTNGNLTIDNNSLLKRGFSSRIDGDTLDVTVTLNPAVNQDKITLTSSNGKVTIKDSNITTALDNFIVNALDSAKGEIFVQNSQIASAGDILLNQAKTHTAGTHITKNSTLNANNIKITTKNADADINADLANFANLNYTERLALNAGRDINVTGAGNLNAVKVDFNAARNNNVDINGNVTTNNVIFNGHNNTITAAGNVNLTNRTTIKAKDSAAPENTITTINAGKDFTTPENDYLNVNNTKLIANADKNTNINLANAQNKNAGVEINAKYTSDQLSDKTVTVNAADNVLAISKIKAGNLNLDKNDTFLAALTTLTGSDIEGVTSNADGRAYIEVANWGQFNLDPLATFDQFIQPDSFEYTDHFVKGQHQPDAGDAIDTYKKHFIEFDSNGVMEKFLLVYEKPVSGCEPPGPVDPNPENPFNPEVSDDLSSLIDQMRLPRQLQPTSRQAAISNNTTDPTTGIVNAAARIEVVDENATTNDDDEEGIKIN